MSDISEKFISYTQAVLHNLKEELGEDYTVLSKSVRKNNGVIATGIIAKKEGQNVSPIIYIDDFYKEGITEEEIKEVADILYNDFRGTNFEKAIDLSDFSVFEKAKKRLAFKLISAEKNSELLQKVPHRRFYNLAVVFYYIVPEITPDGSATILIRDSHMKQWGIRLKELYAAAFENAPVLLPGVIDSMEKIMLDILAGDSGKEISGEDWIKELKAQIAEGICEQKIPMFVLTNRRKLYGAACMLYPGLICEFAEKMKQDFYILPSSVHEVILVPACVDADNKTLKEIVADINRTEVAEGEILSDSVYYYSRNRDKILWLS